MNHFKLYSGSIVLSIAIATMSGCGNSVDRNALSQSNNQTLSSSPFIDQTLSPSALKVKGNLQGKNGRSYGSGYSNWQIDFSLNQTSFNRGDYATINLSDMPHQYDWVGLFYKGDESKRENLLTYAWTGNRDSVKLKLNNTLYRKHQGRLNSGEYEVRIFTWGGYYKELGRKSITINSESSATQPSITLNNNINYSNKDIYITLNNVSQQDEEWVGIYPKGSSNAWRNCLSWNYTRNATNNILVLDGVGSGEYEIRLFSSYDWDLLTSTPLKVSKVQNTNTTISVDKTVYDKNENIVVHYENMPGNNGDWIGIFNEGENSNNKSDAYLYYTTDGQINGDVTFKNIEAGSYEIRVFHEGDSRVINRVTISVKAKEDNSRKVAIFADEHDPHDRLLAVDYENMSLVKEVQVQGSRVHHADVVGNVDHAKYVLMVPKKSNFLLVYSVQTKELVKKIELPFQPRSADAFNPSKNLVLLTSGNRPAAVILDASTWEIVGKAGMNVTCNLKFNQSNTHPWYYKKIVFAKSAIDTSQLNCVAPDFGGQLISGHPIWLGSRHFAVLDRANRLIEVYRLDRKKHNGQWKISLTDVVRTSTSIHQIIPSGKNDGIFYGMSEGNGNGDGIAPEMYKWKFSNGGLIQLANTKLVTQQTITKMKEVGAYELYKEYWNQYKRITPYYNNYFYPTLYKEHNRVFYPGNYQSYFDYIKSKKAQIVSQRNQLKIKVPTQVQQQLNSLGGHNLYISPAVNGVQYLWGAVASGQVFVVNANTMQISSVLKADKGAGHVTFQHNGKYAIVTNHKSRNVTIEDFVEQKFVKNINLPYNNENISSVLQSHAPYVTLDDEYFINSWTDGGVFFRINLDTLTLDSKSLYTGGVPIQGNYYPNYKGD